MRQYGYINAIGLDLGSKLINPSAKKFVEENNYSKYADGGSIAEGNYEMVLSKSKELRHHSTELQNALKKEKNIDAWVVAKVERASADLSDVTHYLDGKSEYADGGEFGGGGMTESEI
ncbi:MAG: hypothetical protein EBQ89_09645, partial [Alphaproteobacteria bacterium]|nr:hypothetical protein [Alphaproteobacteria bacterium]